MNVKEYIEKHNINLPLEAVEEFERNVQNVIVNYPQRTRVELDEAINLLLNLFRFNYKMSPVVTDLKYNATGVLSWFAIDETDQENMVIIPIFDNEYPIERISINAPDGKCKTETVIEDQAPLIAEEVAKLELQAKFESYSKKQWVTVDDELPVRFVDFLKNSQYPFVAVRSWTDGEETVFTMNEDLCDYDNVTVIKETGPYADWKIDAPVKYWDGAYERHAHYAGTDDNGNAMIWSNGNTSWTTKDRWSADFVELVEDEK